MPSQDSLHNQTPDDHSKATAGAIIDEQGQEVPITESMIQQACQALAADSEQHDS